MGEFISVKNAAELTGMNRRTILIAVKNAPEECKDKSGAKWLIDKEYITTIYKPVLPANNTIEGMLRSEIQSLKERAKFLISQLAEKDKQLNKALDLALHNTDSK